MHDEQAPLNPQDIEAYLLGSLSDEQVEAMDRVLKDDPAALAQFAQAIQLMSLVCQEFAGREAYQATHQQEPLLEDFDALLKDLAAREAAAHAPVVSLDPIASTKDDDPDSLSMHQLGVVAGYVFRKVVVSKPFIVSASALAAAIILVATLFLVYGGGGPSDQVAQQSAELLTPNDKGVETPVQAVARLTNEHDAVWLDRPDNNLLPGQRLTLTQGFAEITTNRGAVARLEAPATIQLTGNNNALRLHAGKLVGICETDASKGFLVRTPNLEVTDLGTRFGVEVVGGRSTEVHVYQGEVHVVSRITDAAQSPQTQYVLSNQAVRMDAVSDQLASIEPAFEKFSGQLAPHRLFSTGLELAEGAIDVRWQIVADGQGPLDQPIPLAVQYGEREDNHFAARGNDPATAQWLTYAPGYALYNEPVRPGLDDRSFTIQSRFELADAIALQGVVLYLKYATSELGELRINGQAVEPLPKEGNRNRLQNIFHEVEIAIETTALKHGENVIEIDRPKPAIATQAPMSFYLYSEIRPAFSEADPSPNR